MTTTSVAKTGLSRSPCGCNEQTPSQACCCNLVCFDRPNYFCGHLLTDADLTLQQKYVVEKNKLYHRTMDGYGIVCGLKLTCDCDCKGNILIHDGFAIDDCGNDLVVCETTRFDVIAALRSKGLLDFDYPEDDCEPHQRRSRCDIKQCFYVTICYQETESAYETPFQSSCTSGPKPCMPTRTHEGVRFDLTDTLPPRHSYIDDLEKRIKECFHVNCDSPVGSIIKQHADELLYLFGDTEAPPQGNQPIEPCELFCTLRAYFLNHLKTNPDQFNCNLFDEVSCLSCPRECYDDDDQHLDEGRRKNRRERRREQAAKELHDEESSRYREEIQQAFRKLLYYMQRYQYDCVFGDLVFTCQHPCEANCLVLGTVEVLNRKLVRVCNTPRKYLWAPANLLQVLIYDIMTERLTTGEGCDDKRVPCCPDYRNFDPLYFLTEFRVSQCARRDAAISSVVAFREVSQSLHRSFDFTDSMATSPSLFARMRSEDQRTVENLRAVEALFGISTSTEDLPSNGLNPLTPTQALQAHALLRRNDSVVAYQSEGETKRVLTDQLAEISPDRAVGSELKKLLSQYRQKGEEQAQVTELKAEIETLKRRMAIWRTPGRRKGAGVRKVLMHKKYR